MFYWDESRETHDLKWVVNWGQLSKSVSVRRWKFSSFSLKMSPSLATLMTVSISRSFLYIITNYSSPIVNDILNRKSPFPAHSLSLLSFELFHSKIQNKKQKSISPLSTRTNPLHFIESLSLVSIQSLSVISSVKRLELRGSREWFKLQNLKVNKIRVQIGVISRNLSCCYFKVQRE